MSLFINRRIKTPSSSGAYLVALVMDVDRFPGRGETLTADNFRQTFGGKGSNMAVQLARLGKPVRFAGCVGQDSFGDQFAEMALD